MSLDPRLVQEDKQKGRYVCEMCARAFGRAEHLDRHRRSHDANSHKSFICDYCNKGFTRKDVLSRHTRAVHESHAMPRTSRRKSCNRCAGYKIKCTGGPLCQACKQRGLLCEFDKEGWEGEEERAKRQRTSSLDVNTHPDFDVGRALLDVGLLHHQPSDNHVHPAAGHVDILQIDPSLSNGNMYAFDPYLQPADHTAHHR